MKRKIGEIKGHPIIVGDINLKNEHEIHVSQLLKGLSSSPPSVDIEGTQIATEAEVDELIDKILNI